MLLAGCAQPTPAPTATPIPPTATPLSPTATPVPPTLAPVPEVDDIPILANYITEKFANWMPVVTADQVYENLTDGDTTNDPFIGAGAQQQRLPPAAEGRADGPRVSPWEKRRKSGRR